MSILTFKIKHNKNFSSELSKAMEIAKFSLENKTLSSKDVKSFGLKSAISNQILRKYVKNKKIKKVHKCNLIIPGQSIQYSKDSNSFRIPCLNLILSCENIHRDFLEIKSAEIDCKFCYISCKVEPQNSKSFEKCIGVDFNSTSHIAVVANPNTGKVLKLGKKAPHVRKKYSKIRRNLQKKKRFSTIKKIRNKEYRICYDINHKISKTIVDFAIKNNCNINLENLKGIRKNTKGKKSLSHNLNNWSFFQLRKMIEYKAELRGIKINLIDPKNTSKLCSKSGLLGEEIFGERDGKIFKSPKYGVENADVNAAFNISLKGNICIKRCFQLAEERDSVKS